METLDAIVERRLERVVLQRMQDEPVVVLHGPRAVGKSTLLSRIAARCEQAVIDLDDPETRTAVADGPRFFLEADGPILVDEYQHVPEMLDVIKSLISQDPRPGRFVLTGSTSYTTIPRAAQSLTGRASVLTVWPLSQGEIHGRHERFVADLITDPHALMSHAVSETDRSGYAELALAGGLPIPLRRQPGPSRLGWFHDYLDLVIERDVLDIRRIRQRAVLPRLLERLAAQTGQILNIASAARGVGLEPSVAGDYTQLLEAVFLVHRLPAWGTTLGSRVNTLPKLHLFDTGVGGWLLDITSEAVAQRLPSVLTEFGHLIETFAVNEILKQCGWLDEPVRVGHYRTHDGSEIDLVLQASGANVVAIEIKAAERVHESDTRPLARLRERLGARFRGGVVLHTGRYASELGDRLYALPLDSVWA